MQKVCHLLNRGLWFSVSLHETLIYFMDQLPPLPLPLVSLVKEWRTLTRPKREEQKFVGKFMVHLYFTQENIEIVERSRKKWKETTSNTFWEDEVVFLFDIVHLWHLVTFLLNLIPFPQMAYITLRGSLIFQTSGCLVLLRNQILSQWMPSCRSCRFSCVFQ